jgi:diguanylate cyclase (GGDEF)-like protein
MEDQGTAVNLDIESYQRLIDIGRALSAERNFSSLLERILREAKLIARADAGSLYIKTDHDTLAFAIVLYDSLGLYQGGTDGDPISFPELPLLLEDGSQNMVNVAARSFHLGETIYFADVYETPENEVQERKAFDKITGYSSRSFLTVPLKNVYMEGIGVLQLLNAKDKEGNVVEFPETVRPLTEALASQAAVAMEYRRLLDEQELLKLQLESEVDVRTEELQNALSKLSEAHIVLKDLTTIDPVTGLRNRQFFDDVLEREWRRAERQKYPMALLMLDIDHFKNVNDTYGHLAGDICLAGVAKCMADMFKRPADVVARFGGEEFIVIMPYMAHEDAREFAEKVRSVIASSTFNADGHIIEVTVSIGVATMIPDDLNSSRQLIAQADAAMYKAKAAGRNSVCD